MLLIELVGCLLIWICLYLGWAWYFSNDTESTNHLGVCWCFLNSFFLTGPNHKLGSGGIYISGCFSKYKSSSSYAGVCLCSPCCWISGTVFMIETRDALIGHLSRSYGSDNQADPWCWCIQRMLFETHITLFVGSKCSMLVLEGRAGL